MKGTERKKFEGDGARGLLEDPDAAHAALELEGDLRGRRYMLL